MDEFAPKFEINLELVKEKINSARLSIPTKEDFDKRQRIETELVTRFLNGVIDSDEYEKLHNKLVDDRGITRFSDSSEFEIALRYLKLTDEKIREILLHEKDHFEVDQKNKLKPIYLIKFFRLTDGKVGMIPSVICDYPDDVSDDKKREFIRESLEAPENPSDSDLNKLSNKSK